MLAELEDAVVGKLGDLRQQLPRLVLRSYGGELSDGDMLADTLAAGHAVLVTTPRARFSRRSARRFLVQGTLRLVICSRQARDERSTRHGTAGSLGTYALWSSCVALLTDYVPLDGAKGLVPTDFSNLVNGRDQKDFLSVLGQSFDFEANWTLPEDAGELLAGIDLNYYLQPDDGVADAIDRVTLEAP
jgi:hypothetical protein